MLTGKVRSVKELAIYVELELFGGCVADTNRARATIAFKVRQLKLG